MTAPDRLTENDRRTLSDIHDTITLGGYQRFVPHTQAERVGVRRLVAFSMAKDLGPCSCRDCDNPRHEDSDAPASYVLTAKGKRAIKEAP